jgi:hemerythrin-like domain-containing protein
MAVKRSRELKPLSSEHQQALLVAYQLKKGIAGHSESAGAPKDLPGLLALARRYDDAVFRSHTRAEEDLLGRHLSEPDMRRLQSEHREMERLLEFARTARPDEMRASLASFADLLERHIRWEERELFVAFEQRLGADVLASVGHELEKRLVMGARNDPKAQRRPQ